MALILLEQELLKAFSEMDHNKIEKESTSSQPHGRIWEGQIRSARATFNSLLQTHGHSLDEESLQTLITETESIINSRILTVETINDGQIPMLVSPNILTMKEKEI